MRPSGGPSRLLPSGGGLGCSGHRPTRLGAPAEFRAICAMCRAGDVAWMFREVTCAGRGATKALVRLHHDIRNAYTEEGSQPHHPQPHQHGMRLWGIHASKDQVPFCP